MADQDQPPDLLRHPDTITEDDVRQMWQTYFGREPNDSEIQGAIGHPGGYHALLAAVQGTDESKNHLNPQAPPTAPQAPPTAPPNPGIDPNGPALKPFDKTFTPPPMLDLGGPDGVSYIPPAPNFGGGPAFPDIPSFQAPTGEEAMNEPGYAVTEQRGRDNLQSWAAAKGTLNDGETAKALIDYGQNSASQQYQNVWGRKYNTYQGDVQNKYVLPWQAKESQWLGGTVGPGMQAWQTMAQAGQHQNDMNYLNANNNFLNDWNIFKDQRDSSFDKLFKWSTQA